MKNFVLFISLLFLSRVSVAQTNYAVSFNGSSDVNCGAGSGLNITGTALTVEAWIYPTAFGANYWQNSIVAKDAENITGFVLRCGGSGQLSFAIALTGNVWTDLVSGNNVVGLNKWQHVAAVYDGSQILLYRDGALVASTAENRTLLADASFPLKIGGSPAAWAPPARYFTGAIEEVRVWNVARTAAEIKSSLFRNVLGSTGLAAAYQMNDGTGTSLTDNSGNGHTGTLSAGASWTASPVQASANALHLDGSDDFVSIPNTSSLNLTTSLTIESWIFATKTTGMQDVVCKSSLSQNTGYIFPRTDDGWQNLVAYLHIGGAWRIFSVPFPSLNTWHHLAVTYDGAQVKIYINGTLATTQAYSGAITTNTNPLTIGAQPGYSSLFGGAVDDIRIWNVVRTQAEIQNSMNAELNPSTQSGLVSYYTANQGIANGNNTGLATLIDQSGNNNGTITNLALSGSSSNYIPQKSGLTVLPLTWRSFTVTNQNDHAFLQWQTSGEQNTKDFIIQRSSDGTDWQEVGQVMAAGNSSQIMDYRFTDPATLHGVHYYRLLQRDLDNRASYSIVRAIRFQPAAKLFTISGNPVLNRQLKVLVKNARVTLSIYNSIGSLMWRKTVSTGTTTINLSEFAKGVYSVKAGDQTEQIIVP